MLTALQSLPRVSQIADLIEEILDEGSRPEIVCLLATLAYWRIVAMRAKLIRGESPCLFGSARAKKTVTTSVPQDSEQRLLTADEAAMLSGPSFTAKRLYRLRGSMPEQAWVRKGGRLYFREGPYRRWLATR